MGQPWLLICLLALTLLALVGLFLSRKVRRLSEALDHEKGRVQSAELKHRQALDEAQSRQEALFDSMVEGVLLLDSSGRIVLANHAIERLFGVLGDLRGRTLLEALRLESLDQVASRTLTTSVLGSRIGTSELGDRNVALGAATLVLARALASPELFQRNPP